jgi:predicted transcriptional regulator
MSATWYSDKCKAETDEKVISALASGPLTQSQIAKMKDISDTGVFHSIKRLCAEGYVRETGVRIRATKGVAMAMTYELDQPREIVQNTVKHWDDEPFRHWQDAALFGDYVPAKNPASTRAEAA